ncbi:Spo0E like sporulation regulatory protein [Anaerobacterium chartisolvens]|uniref:Spo0E like sporulation regulatory protein n=1 Tax=Anaerobacterium chartisolvens TaxID=1297424 RepID=A0A369AMR7_9FIRM|nr:aspartyl-phosphate phosphatase Spo0E family protein [Anaerobacterium chartisolvens]RCX09618.1 Spo0E like sporulation regulatory protein [Anaerobacterium chartisolvens]
MEKRKELENEIESMKKTLNLLIHEKSELVDPDITAASQRLDTLLNKYYKINDEGI